MSIAIIISIDELIIYWVYSFATIKALSAVFLSLISFCNISVVFSATSALNFSLLASFVIVMSSTVPTLPKISPSGDFSKFTWIFTHLSSPFVGVNRYSYWFSWLVFSFCAIFLLILDRSSGWILLTQFSINPLMLGCLEISFSLSLI